jgi:hypothetical protein
MSTHLNYEFQKKGDDEPLVIEDFEMDILAQEQLAQELLAQEQLAQERASTSQR